MMDTKLSQCFIKTSNSEQIITQYTVLLESAT